MSTTKYTNVSFECIMEGEARTSGRTRGPVGLLTDERLLSGVPLTRHGITNGVSTSSANNKKNHEYFNLILSHDKIAEYYHN